MPGLEGLVQYCSVDGHLEAHLEATVDNITPFYIPLTV